MPRHPHPRRTSQQGAALLVMVVVMVLGIAAVLVGSLNSNAVNIARQQQTSAALAQAKDALIGYAATDTNRPGELPCPDVDGDGKLTMGVDFSTGSPPVCSAFVGYLPWKTLDLPELRDGYNEKLWYALAQNFYAGNSVALNSDTTGQLSINGDQSINNVAAIIVSPGAPLCGRSHATNNINQYLEAIPSVTATTALAAPASTDCSISAPYPAYNDTLLAVRVTQIMQPVEMRIAREAKACLDNYAVANGQKYPWAVDPSDVMLYYSKPNTLFGRIPRHSVPDSDVQNFINALNTFQVAVNNCANNTGSSATLISTGNSLENAANQAKNNQPTTPPLPSTVTSPARSAGDKARDSAVTCNDIRNNPLGNGIQTNLNSTLAALNTLPPSLAWPASCTSLSAAYWADWRNHVYYQLDWDYGPSGSLTSPNISINGTGNYRAAVIVARGPVGTQIRNPSQPNTYLEGTNVHNNPNPNTGFVSNSPGSPGYMTVNDLVLCLDARVNCK